MNRFTFAIGDIHGRLDLLERAADVVTAYLADRDAVGRVICLGDYVDRGPDSKGVVEFLMEAQKLGALECLRGNHEAMMVLAHDEPSLMDMWLGPRWGGTATMDSYGGRAPQEHLDWLASLPVLHRDELRLFVHAGFMPGVPLEKQDEESMLWIRDRFFLAEEEFEGWPYIVHGHTPTHPWKENPAEPEVLGWRTNLDTGAVRTGVLAVGVFTDARPQPLEVLKVTL